MGSMSKLGCSSLRGPKRRVRELYLGLLMLTLLGSCADTDSRPTFDQLREQIVVGRDNCMAQATSDASRLICDNDEQQALNRLEMQAAQSRQNASAAWFAAGRQMQQAGQQWQTGARY